MDYFSDLLGSATSPPLFVQSDLDMLFNFKCADEQVANFEKAFTKEDIKAAFSRYLKIKQEGLMDILQSST